jgi:hypothetical protein
MNTAPAEQRSSSECGEHLPATTRSGAGLGIDDVVIFPLVLLALVAKKLLQAILSILIHVLDYAFPILLQMMRFPLFTLRIIGDTLVALVDRFIRYLPISITSRDAVRELLKRHWSWLRQKVSYRAFEEALHRSFEAGMRWIFITCRGLTPGGRAVGHHRCSSLASVVLNCSNGNARSPHCTSRCFACLDAVAASRRDLYRQK